MSNDKQIKTYILKIYRGTPGNQYWEEFELTEKPSSNIISALMEIQQNPINRKGEKVTPVVWEAGCLEEVCGSCSMLINGKPRQACAALITTLLKTSQDRTITLAPFSKFPLVRDLIIDRDRMFENLKRAQAWIEVDGIYDRGPGPKITPSLQEVRYSLSTCMTCGCCVEACPQASVDNKFIGPQIFGQVRLFNIHPVGALKKNERLYTMMQEGGIADCGNAQNCQKVCPKDVPLLESISTLGREVNLQVLKDLFNTPER